MTNEEAKFILNGYRPNGRDATDATFGEALRQARSDPALGAWLARSQAYDGAVAEKLAQIAPPAGLREAILTGARVSGKKRVVWRQPAWLAAAAAVAVLLGSAVALRPRQAAAAEPLTKFAMVDALEGTKHGGHGTETGLLQAELSNSSTHLGKGVSLDFAALEKTGCRTVSVDGWPVLEVCFNRNGTWFHCYVARCGDFPTLPAKEGPRFAEDGKVSAVAWADGAYRFVVAGIAGREAIEQLL